MVYVDYRTADAGVVILVAVLQTNLCSLLEI